MPESKRRELKKELGLPSNEPYIIPSFSGTMEHLKDESFMIFGASYHKHKKYYLFYGIGIVYRVVKGDKQDLVYINFGIFKERRTRLVVVYENHARRQLLTLKRGQVCQVYGICRFFTQKICVNGTMANGVRLGLYAQAIQGWYVPTMMDIKKLPINEDLVEPTEKEKELQRTFEDVLNDFLNGTGEEE